MKNAKKFMSIILCLSMLLSLCACGNGSVKETEQGVPAETKEPEIFVNADEENGTYTLSEYLSTGETIWYEFKENKGKDSYVGNIYVLNPDGTIYYMEDLGYKYYGKPRPSYKLGELEQMEDSDIVAMVKEWYIEEYAAFPYAFYLEQDEETVTNDLFRVMLSTFPHSAEYEDLSNYKENLQNTLNGITYDLALSQWKATEEMNDLWVNMQNSLEDETALYIVGHPFYSSVESFENGYAEALERGLISTSDYELMKTATEKICSIAEEAAMAIYRTMMKDVEERRANPVFSQYKLTIVSDTTGNNTDHMQLVYTNPMKSEFTVNQKDIYLYPAPTGAGNTNMVVYDSQYNGFNTKNSTVFVRSGLLYTRIDGNFQLVLDQIGQSDLPVDVWDVESLFG